MEIDHLVLWVASPRRSLEFFVDVLGLVPVRAQEFEEGAAPFPSVRVNDAAILDLMDSQAIDLVREFTGSAGKGGGTPVNHLCLSMDAASYDSVAARLRDRGVELKSGGDKSFGAQGLAVRSAYFDDPDGNVIEIRHYDDTASSMRRSQSRCGEVPSS